MRTYEDSWLALKKSKRGYIVIVAHPKLHSRIYKAVRKEKNLDIVFKLELSENAQKAWVSRRSIGMQLTITLHKSDGFKELGFEEAA